MSKQRDAAASFVKVHLAKGQTDTRSWGVRLEGTEMLDWWCELYGTLTPSQRESFLTKPELEVMSEYPELAVITALRSSKKLSDCAAIVRQDGWWFRGDACEPDNLPFCARCKPHGFPTVVFMTRGWSNAFHRAPDCTALAQGQDYVTDRGGEPAPLTDVHIQTALASGRRPCLICFGKRTS